MRWQGVTIEAEDTALIQEVTKPRNFSQRNGSPRGSGWREGLTTEVTRVRIWLGIPPQVLDAAVTFSSGAKPQSSEQEGKVEVSNRPSLENALAKTEGDATSTLKATRVLLTAVRRLRLSAQLGNLGELRTAMDAAEKALAIVSQQFANAKGGWDFNEEACLLDGSFISEILAAAEKVGLRVFERDDRLYCYPALIRVSPAERSVLIDKTREKRLRPTVLVAHLKELQRKPPPFRPAIFMEALYSAYKKAVASRGKDLFGTNAIIALMELYELFTLLPGQSKEYSKQEFARDIYLLHKSRIDTTKDGSKINLVMARSKLDRKAITALTEEGEERHYYGISFAPGNKE